LRRRPSAETEEKSDFRRASEHRRASRVSNRASVELRRDPSTPTDLHDMRAATFVTSSPLQLRPTYAIEGSAKRSESVRPPNTKKHLSRDSRVIRGLYQAVK
jgi:hypothetical protein